MKKADELVYAKVDWMVALKEWLTAACSVDAMVVWKVVGWAANLVVLLVSLSAVWLVVD